jgi:hypothetical protein
MNEIKLPYATLTYKEPIVFIRYKDNTLLDTKEINEIFKACHTLTGNEPYLIFADLTNFVDSTNEANKASVDKENIANLVASATLVKLLGQRLQANAFLEVNKPPYPMQVFTDKDEAVKWLLEQKSTKN